MDSKYINNYNSDKEKELVKERGKELKEMEKEREKEQKEIEKEIRKKQKKEVPVAPPAPPMDENQQPRRRPSIPRGTPPAIEPVLCWAGSG